MEKPWPALLGLFLLAAPAAAQVQLTYVVGSDSVTITGYTGIGTLQTLDIPDSLVGLPVTAIGDYAFDGLDSITNVVIPAGVGSIGIGAFYGSPSLAAITVGPANPVYSSTNGVLFDKSQATLIECPGALAGSYSVPDGVTTIAVQAFGQCVGLGGIILPDGLLTIADEAFEDCTGLTNVSLPANVANVGITPFFDCTSLTNIGVALANPAFSSLAGVLFDKDKTTLIEYPGGLGGAYSIPATVTALASNSFADCGGLTGITVPASLTNAGNGPFQDCSQLKTLTVSGSNLVYSSAANVLFNKNKTVLVQYPGGLAGSYTIPATVTNIAAAAFQACSGLTSVAIPATAKTIGPGAFEDCPDLAKVTLAAGIAVIGSNAFDNCSRLAAITVPGTIGVVGSGAFENCSLLESATMDSGVADIGAGAFENCYSLDAVVLPATVTNISSAAFEYCLSLTSITIPDNVGVIGPNAFAFCSGLSSVSIPDSVTNLGQKAFEYCSSISGVALPAKITAIAPYTFYECADLVNITIPGDVTDIGLGAFDQCYSLSSVVIPANVTSIDYLAFADCTSLSQISIPAGVTNIGDTAFNECSRLTAINVATQNQFYASSNGIVFDNNLDTLLECPGGLAGSYTIPDGVTQIGDYAFENCASLTNVVIPSSVTNIGGVAFANCTGLSSITIPSSVTFIGNAAFEGAPLAACYFLGDAPALGESVFDTNNSLAVYYLPGATGWSGFAAAAGFLPVEWNPVIQTASGFGVQGNQFDFTITGPSNLVVVVEACDDLAAPLWTPLQTVTLSNGFFNFSESFQSNIPTRFYSLGLP